MGTYSSWLRVLAERGGKGTVDNIDARSLGRIADELDRYRKALTDIKDVVCGDKVPNWIGDQETLASRTTIANIADMALDLA